MNVSNANLVRAKHTNGTEEYVPSHWLDKDTSPFPGQWSAVKEDTPKLGETVQPEMAGDTEAPSGTPAAKAGTSSAKTTQGA